jgi:methionine synthase II (cobalamin-independent)
MISIDEPFFSNSMPEYATELMDIITKDLTCPTILHACGDVYKIIPALIELPVDILSHEFKASPHLLEAFSEYSFTQHLCIGAVRSDDPQIEPVDTITDHINKALDHFGDKVLQVSPDCGQRLLSQRVAYQKLKNLVKAGEIINDR